MSLKDYVIQHVDPNEYYKARFPKWDKKYRPNVLCPFHSDTRPSLSLSLKNGGARCHASTCEKNSYGNIVHFEAELKKIHEKDAARLLYKEFVRKIISRKVVQKYRENLHVDPTLLLRIKNELGLGASSIKKFALGYDPESHRLTIPVYDEFGNCVNIRFYKIPSLRNKNDYAKIYNYKKGYGSTDLFPAGIAETYSDRLPLLVMSAETETMLAIQDGYQAVCSTTGEGTWNPDWNTTFAGYEVFTVFDRDRGGDNATRKITAELLSAGAKSVSQINLPFRSKRKDRKDYRDWRLKEKGDATKLLSYAKQSRQPVRDNHSVDSVPDIRSRRDSKRIHRKQVANPTLPDFATDEMVELAAIGTTPRYLNHRVKTQGIVAAKASNTYTVPWKFKVETKNRPPFDYSLPFGRELLRFVKSSDLSILQLLQELLGSKTIKITPTEFITVSEVEVIPIAAVDRDVPYVTQRCYHFGPEIKANTPYYLEVIPTSEIRSQETIGIITHVEALSKSIDRFDLTTEIETELRGYFCPHEEETVWKKLTLLANDISHNYTHIYNRLDWHIVALLTWASPLQLRFPDSDVVERGWLNSLALGDTETGKSKVCKAIQRITGSGFFVNSEACTFVGIIGGAIKMGSGQFMLRWGRIPLSDKQLVILEELSGLSVEEISNMSDVRSSGIARLDKGGISAQTNSRTRLLCLSNVRSARKNLSNYLYGVRAVQELVGHGEDIARFDLITTLVDREVDIGTINSSELATSANSPNVGLELAFRNLIHYIWSLEPDDIKFSESAWNECLEQTKKLSAIYHPSIPVFKGGSGRYKLGRLAAAIACIQFSRRGEKILIQETHVKAASKLLRFIYDKASFGYRQYSEQMYERETLKHEETLASVLKERITQHLPDVIDSLIHASKFTRDELCSLAGIPLFHADQVIGALLRSRAVAKEPDNNVWAITPAGKTWLELFQTKLKHKHKSNGTHR